MGRRVCGLVACAVVARAFVPLHHAPLPLGTTSFAARFRHLGAYSSSKKTTTTALGVVSGLYGDWEPAAGGSYVLYPDTPAINEYDPPLPAKGVVHFIGGAFVGAASQLTYRYALERVRDAGYLVIATPYRLSFDYVSVCDAIEASLRAALREARRREPGLFGDDDDAPTEVIGVGHSCGALLQALLASKDPGDDEDDQSSPRRRRLALVSFNNKGATEAVPLFDELVVPLATEAMRDDAGSVAPLVRRALDAARGAAAAAIEIIEDGTTRTTVSAPAAADDTSTGRRRDQGGAVGAQDANPLSGLLQNVPSSLPPVPEPLASLARASGVVPLARQSLELADQLPDLLQEVADGARDFEPTPLEVRERLRTSVGAGDALIVQFADDAIDESDDVFAQFRDANTLRISKNVGAEEKDQRAPPMRLRFERLDGTHLTPLTQDIFIPATDVADLARDRLTASQLATDLVDPLLAALPRDQWLGQVDTFADTLLDWLLDDPGDFGVSQKEEGSTKRSGGPPPPPPTASSPPVGETAEDDDEDVSPSDY